MELETTLPYLPYMNAGKYEHKYELPSQQNASQQPIIARNLCLKSL